MAKDDDFPSKIKMSTKTKLHEEVGKEKTQKAQPRKSRSDKKKKAVDQADQKKIKVEKCEICSDWTIHTYERVEARRWTSDINGWKYRCDDCGNEFRQVLKKERGSKARLVRVD